MKRSGEPGGVWTLEEATGLLRELPARSWMIWLAGTLPFTWLLIDFLLEMSHSAFGAERLAGQSVALALLYVVKHVMQGLFSYECLQVLRGDRVALPGGAALARLTLVQAAWQPWRFPGLAVASLAIIPFPWVAAFLRNLGPAAIERERGFVPEAWRLGRGDARAHTVALMVLFLCWVLLFVNLLSLWFVVPMLLKAFFGVQTELTRLAGRMLNGTTFLVTAILTFGALEPVMGALAAVRTFYSQARSSGADLRGALRRTAAAVVMGVLLMSGATAQERPLDKAALDRQLDDVLRDPEFAWKLPAAEKAKDAGSGGWLRDLFRTLENWAQWIHDLYRKLFPDGPPNANAGAKSWSVNAELLRWAMIAVAVLAAGSLVMILLSRRRDAKKTVLAQAKAVSTVNLEDESVSAAQLVEDEWLRMADSFAAQGEFRLAMRAVQLAGLRYLGEKGWVTLQPAKTGLEYERELGRRRRDSPLALEGYGQGRRLYEGVWYGFSSAAAENYRTLRMTWEEMRRHA